MKDAPEEQGMGHDGDYEWGACVCGHVYPPGEVVRLEANESHSTTSGPVGVQPEPAEERTAFGPRSEGHAVWAVVEPAVPVVHPEPGEGAHERAFAAARTVLTVEGYGRIGPQVLDAIVAAAVATVRADTAAMVEVEARKWLGRGVLATGQAEAFLRIASRIAEDRS